MTSHTVGSYILLKGAMQAVNETETPDLQTNISWHWDISAGAFNVAQRTNIWFTSPNKTEISYFLIFRLRA